MEGIIFRVIEVERDRHNKENSKLSSVQTQNHMKRKRTNRTGNMNVSRKTNMQNKKRKRGGEVSMASSRMDPGLMRRYSSALLNWVGGIHRCLP